MRRYKKSIKQNYNLYSLDSINTDRDKIHRLLFAFIFTLKIINKNIKIFKYAFI